MGGVELHPASVNPSAVQLNRIIRSLHYAILLEPNGIACTRRSAGTAHRHSPPDLSADTENCKHVQFHPDDQMFGDEKAYDLQKTDSRRPSETAALIDEALNRQEAKDRHTQFLNHIAESITLIHDILTCRRRSSDTVQGDDGATDEKTTSARGIGVLGNMLRLEAKIHHIKSHDATTTLHFTDKVTSIKKQPRAWLKAAPNNKKHIAPTKFGFCFIPTAFASFIVILPGYSIAIAIAIIELSPPIQTPASLQNPALPLSHCPVVCHRILSTIASSLVALANHHLCFSLCGFTVNWLLSCLANAPQQVIQVVPALTVGLIGNILTNLTGKMTFDAVLTAILYLVPGSLGLKAALGAFGGSITVYQSQGASFAQYD
ncbi:hypothetical protein BJV82DRAFT_717140 [Fennellomyces sp. T-0311]|nr:hypothetical protein BJV82DRAFT_717140 [Fennellomyces sp. T-0311]